jgi:hypothetical protein
MKFDQFAYWLQGHFELQDHFSDETLANSKENKNQFLTGMQVDCIKNHIQLHFECVKREKADPDPFICWLDGSLTYFENLPTTQQETLVVEVKTRLNNLFIHKIDPKMPGDKKSLQDIHDGKKTTDRRRPPRSGGGRELRLMC